VADELFARRLADPPDPVGWQGQAAAGTTFAGVDLARVEAPTLVLHRITAPTLVIWGDGDRLVPPVYAHEFGERIAGARVELVEGGGHLFFWERPEAFVRILAEFLAA
jgi:pimeloyl-ACP methyl ester carboxylesterase